MTKRKRSSAKTRRICSDFEKRAAHFAEFPDFLTERFLRYFKMISQAGQAEIPFRAAADRFFREMQLCILFHQAAKVQPHIMTGDFLVKIIALFSEILSGVDIFY